MNIRYKTEKKKNYILVHAEGTTADPDDVINYLRDVLTEPESENVDRFLLDHRDVKFERNNIGTYDVAVRCMRLVSEIHPVKVALLTRPERMDLVRIYETLGVGEGMEIKVFERLKMASVWLSS